MAFSTDDVRQVITALGQSSALDLVLKIDWSTDTVALGDLDYALTAPGEELVQAVTDFVNGN